MLLLSNGWMAVSGLQGKSHLQTAAGLFAQLRTQIAQADLPQPRGTLGALQADIEAA